MASEEKQLPKTVKIKGSYCRHYSAIHHAQFHRNQFDLVNGVDKTKLKIPEVAMQKWEGEVKEEIDLNEKAAWSVHTKALLEKDEERDKLLTHLFGIIRFNHYSPVQATAKAAEKMESIFGKYIAANIQREGFEDESGHIVGLLNDAAPYTAEIAALGLTDTITQLKTVNDAYEALRKERRSETVTAKTEALKVLRPKTDASYEYICSYIEAAYITATSDDVKTLIERLVSDMNQVITDFKGSHKSSLAQKKAAKEPKEPKEPKDPKQPKEPKTPEKPKDPKQPEKPGGGSGEPPKKPDEKPKDPKKPDDGNPDITLPEE
ncbi:hypothetical protein T235_06945 [Tannerella sp. oral taxon BU063 isolate Cell 8/11]|uniref:Uncharacterized protein n=1 Tax=Tannerella sp. oral taxon BU063 isolate Cell 8/11 TaxID=1411915 RepID=W2D240_9BACT|nr:hypothetical protein T235_06945 [Tannerella sp. oral taxon BU063 isolate Cell 8/11]